MPIAPDVLLHTALAVLVYVLAWYVASLVLRDASIMDIAWGPGFVLVMAVAWLTEPVFAWRPAAIGLLAATWAFRLAGHIFARNRNRGEDARYAAWRVEAGRSWWWRSFFKVFALQGLILWLVSAPLVVLVTTPGPAAVTPWDVAALVLWVVGFLFEAVGDAQLAAFRRDRRNRGRIMDRGLWRYSRHPNYFGECVLWVGYGLAAIAVPGGWMTLFGPVLMIWLIVRISGVTMLERLMTASRPGYAAYVLRTPAFFPWFPKED